MKPLVKTEKSCDSTGIFLLAAAFAATPLIFFTDFTRNPYYSQIVFLYILVSLTLGWRLMRGLVLGRAPFPSAAPDTPFAAWLGVCLLSLAVSFFGHGSFFRPAIVSEGLRNFIFTAVICFGGYQLGKTVTDGGEPFRRPFTGLYGFLLWGLLWLPFQSLKAAPGGGTFSPLFDVYGWFLYILLIVLAVRMLKNWRMEDFVHVAFGVGAVAAGYGILQNFGVDWIWTRAMSPYGSRPVSTFGNPNFLSSYLVMLMPLSFVYYLRSSGLGRWVYGGFFMLFEAALLATLTRSSWLGAGLGLGLLLLLPYCRQMIFSARKAVIVLACAAFVMLAAWPSGTAGGYHPSVAGRIAEMGKMKGVAFSLSQSEENMYSPWHQRLLIWSSCSQMDLENPLTGKGWGVLELFYPFYQGPLILAYNGAQNLRTHANNAHNEIIEVWSQTGILGLGVFIWLLVVIAVAFLRGSKARTPDSALFAAAVGGGLAGMLADNMFNVSFHFAVPAFLFWFGAGMIVTPVRREDVNFGGRRAVAAVSAACAFLIMACVFWAAQWMREVYFFDSLKLSKNNRLGGALVSIEKAYRWFPREVNTDYEMGNLYARNGDMSRAVWAYGEALAANSGYDEIYFNRAITRLKTQGGENAAMNDLRTCLFINPLHMTAYNLAFDLLSRTPDKNADEALSILNTAKKAFPENLNVYNMLGYFYLKSGRPAEAAAVLREGLQKDSMENVVAGNLLRALAALKVKGDPAITRFQTLSALQESTEKGGAARAVAELKKYLSSNEDDASARVLLARALYLSGDEAGALSELSAVLQKRPLCIRANFAMAYMAEASGDRSAAADYLRRVQRADPQNAQARDRLARLGR